MIMNNDEYDEYDCIQKVTMTGRIKSMTTASNRIHRWRRYLAHPHRLQTLTRRHSRGGLSRGDGATSARASCPTASVNCFRSTWLLDPPKSTAPRTTAPPSSATNRRTTSLNETVAPENTVGTSLTMYIPAHCIYRLHTTVEVRT